MVSTRSTRSAKAAAAVPPAEPTTMLAAAPKRKRAASKAVKPEPEQEPEPEPEPAPKRVARGRKKVEADVPPAIAPPSPPKRAVRARTTKKPAPSKQPAPPKEPEPEPEPPKRATRTRKRAATPPEEDAPAPPSKRAKAEPAKTETAPQPAKRKPAARKPKAAAPKRKTVPKKSQEVLVDHEDAPEQVPEPVSPLKAPAIRMPALSPAKEHQATSNQDEKASPAHASIAPQLSMLKAPAIRHQSLSPMKASMLFSPPKKMSQISFQNDSAPLEEAKSEKPVSPLKAAPIRPLNMSFTPNKSSSFLASSPARKLFARPAAISTNQLAASQAMVGTPEASPPAHLFDHMLVDEPIPESEEQAQPVSPEQLAQVSSAHSESHHSTMAIEDIFMDVRSPAPLVPTPDASPEAYTPTYDPDDHFIAAMSPIKSVLRSPEKLAATPKAVTWNVSPEAYSPIMEAESPLAVAASPIKSALRSPEKFEATPKTVTWNASPEAYSPMNEADSSLFIAADGPLNGLVCFMDVQSNGHDQKYLFNGMLEPLGAQVVSTWSSNSMELTHVIFKDGSPLTLDKVRASNGKVKCVSIGWAIDCEQANAHLDETPYLVNITNSPTRPPTTPLGRVAASKLNALTTPRNPRAIRDMLSSMKKPVYPLSAPRPTSTFSKANELISSTPPFAFTPAKTPSKFYASINSSIASMPETPGSASFLSVKRTPTSASALSSIASIPSTPSTAQFEAPWTGPNFRSAPSSPEKEGFLYRISKSVPSSPSKGFPFFS